MKTLLAALLLSSPLLAGSYTVTTVAKEDNALTRAMSRANRQTCARFGLAPGCTQVQAREQFCRIAGFGGQRDPASTPQNPLPNTPLVSVCAGSAQVDVFSTLDAFVQSEWNVLLKENYGKKSDAEDLAAWEAAKKAATNAQKNAACAALSLPNGCLP